MAGVNINVATKFDLWWDFKNPEQDSLWGSYIEISEEFRQAILQAPVPLRTDILKALRKSPLALDVYMWTSYRLFVMQSTGQESIALAMAGCRNNSAPALPKRTIASSGKQT